MYEKISRILKKICESFVVILFLGMVLVVFSQVLFRYVFQSSLTWSEELSRFLMVWMVFLGTVLLYDDKGHMMVDALISHLRGVPELIVQSLAQLLIILFCGIILAGSISVLPMTAMQRSPANSIAMCYVYLAIPSSMFLMGIMATRQFLHILITFKKGENK